MASRDTIIEVVDRRLGYRAQIRVPYDVLQLALRDSSEDYLPSGRPLPRVKGARDHICIQAKQALAQRGRTQRYLPWSDISDSVRASDQIPARGTPHDAPVSVAYRAQHPVSVPEDVSAEHEPDLNPAYGQLSLFGDRQLSFD